MQIKPVGVVIGDPDDEFQTIEVREEYADALLRVEHCEHLLVMFWMSELDPDHVDLLQVHPRGDMSRPLTGIFATHSPMRPNPIGVTRVRLIKCDGLRLTVEGLDAWDQSPVVDIKSG